MREIKFRVYDIQANRMITQYELALYKLYDMLFGQDESIKVMQYTGLKDKNGVEIYEGDYIETRKFKNVKVFYDDGLFKVEYQKRDNLILIQPLGYFLTKNKSSKIIGNIYENLELLND